MDVDPDPVRVETLRAAIRSEADGLSAEGLARAVLERYIMESKSRTGKKERRNHYGDPSTPQS